MLRQTFTNFVSMFPLQSVSCVVSRYLLALFVSLTSSLPTDFFFLIFGWSTVSRGCMDSGLWSSHLSPAERDRLWLVRDCNQRKGKVNTMKMRASVFYVGILMSKHCKTLIGYMTCHLNTIDLESSNQCFI